jgi:phenylacetate-CoA ligase
VSAFGLHWHYLRFGSGYQGYVQAYQSRDRYTAEEWAAYQTDQLRAILKTAAQHVPYYRETWSDAEKAAANACRLSDLPLLEKDPLRSNPNRFARDDIHPGRIHHFATSGSTGTPISAFFTTPELRQSLALREVRSARWAGVSFKEPRATFSGRMVEPNPNSKGPYYRFNLAERQVYFSPFHLKPDTARDYIEALRRHQIKWLTGYAVSFYLLGRFILERRLAVPPLKALITTSEKTTPEMRSVMEQAFGCRVFEEYSTVENVLFASECEHGRLHVSPDIAVIEILRPNGEPCDQGEVGEVVATSLLKTFQPLIRFRLGDLAAWDGRPCPCGRQMPVIREVVGRIEDVVIGPDGRQMVRFHGVFVNQPHVREGQVIQETLDQIRVKVVPASGFDQEDEHEIIERVRQRLGPEVTVTVEQVAEIPRTKSGKFRAVISNLNAKP